MTELKKEEKFPVVQVVFQNLQKSVKLEENLLNQIQQMERMGLSSTTEYKHLKMRQFEETFFALFLLRLTKSFKNKRKNQSHLDVIRSFKSNMKIFKKQDRDDMRKKYSKMKFAKKLIHDSIEKSFLKSEKYISILENEINVALKK